MGVNAILTRQAIGGVVHRAADLLAAGLDNLLDQSLRVRVGDADVEDTDAAEFKLLVARLRGRVDELEHLDADAVAAGQDAELQLSHRLWVRNEGVVEGVGIVASVEVVDLAHQSEAQD